MKKQKVVERLVELGMTTYEAKVFLALTRLGEASVSQIHCIADVPRSAIYDTIGRLEQRGIVEVSTGRPKRFRPLSPKAAMNRIESGLIDAGKEAQAGLEALAGSEHRDRSDVRIWTIRGKSRIIDKIADLVGSARKELLIAGHPDLLLKLEGLWKRARKGTRVFFFTGKPQDIQRLARYGDILDPRFGTGLPGIHPPMALFVRADSRTVLFTSETSGSVSEDEATAFWTDDESFVRFILYVTEPMILPKP